MIPPVASQLQEIPISMAPGEVDPDYEVPFDVLSDSSPDKRTNEWNGDRESIEEQEENEDEFTVYLV